MIVGWQESRWVESFGAGLLEMIWQAAAVGLGLAGVLALLRRAPARQRYGWSCAALFALPLVFGLTVWSAHDGVAALAWLPAAAARDLAAWMRALAPALPWLVAAWAAGVSLFALQAFGGWCLVRRARRRAADAIPEEWRWRFQRLRAVLGGGRRLAAARLGLSREVAAPCVVGCWRPLVLLPLSLLSSLPPAQVEAVLAHELAHVRRADYLVNLLQRAVEVLFFYHPAVWWISRQVSEEREHCCDDAALAACGDRGGYARALLALAQSGEAAYAVAATGGSLPRRVRRILGQASVRPGWRAALAMAVVAALGLALAGRLPVRASRARAALPPRSVRAASAPAPVAPSPLHAVPTTPVVLRAKPRPQKAIVARRLDGPAAPAPRTLVVTVSLAVTSTCSPRLEVVRQVAPTGESWLTLVPVMQCRRQWQPISVWTLTT